MSERKPSSVTSSCGNQYIYSKLESTRTHKLVLLTTNIWNIHVVGGWTQFFEFFAGKDVESDKMDLCVTVLSSLGGGHVNNLAWSVLDDYETVLAQS